MRCIAATRHGSPLRGTLNPTESGLTNSQWPTHQADMGLFREFPCPAGTAGFRVRQGEEAPKGLGWWLGGGRGTCSPDRRRAAPQAVADGFSPRRLPWSREAPLLYRGVFFLRRECGAVRCARPRKRVAARGCARARRATGGFACKHASALSPALAMRCIAATRHGSPLRGTQNPTEIGLTNSLRLIHQSTMGLFREFPCPAAGGLLWSREAQTLQRVSR